MPNDISILGVYIPPLLVSFMFGLGAASLTLRLLSNRGLVKYFSNPQLVFFATTAIYTVVLSSTVFPS